jgi:pimeloyl-ACP methyl ester carboxylesterase
MINPRSRDILTTFVAIAALCQGAAAIAAEPPRTEDVTVTAKCDGSAQRYVIAYPEGFKAGEGHSLFIVLHGHGSDRWQFIHSPRDECKAARDAAAAHGMLLVSPDYRAATSWMGPKAESDLLQILDELQARFHLGKVIVSGGSMGATSALTFAAMHPDRVDGVVALNGTANHLEYENFQDAISESFGGTKAAIPQEYKNRSAEYWPERLRMPIAMTVGGQDKIVPPESVIRLAKILKKLQPNVLLIERPAGEHSSNYADSRAAFEFVIGKVLSPKN